ncbi:hypothetical protein CDL60_09240 [Roseateles noduli]|nr:hypothetical protein CDL60_09240 [Roseateles noduli]
MFALKSGVRLTAVATESIDAAPRCEAASLDTDDWKEVKRKPRDKAARPACTVGPGSLRRSQAAGAPGVGRKIVASASADECRRGTGSRSEVSRSGNASRSAATSAQPGAPARRAGNGWVVDAFIAGTRNELNVLKVTCSCISRCGGNVAAARACVDELKRAVREEVSASGMKHRQVAPDVVIYSALISAYEKAGDPVGARAAFDEMEPKGLAPNVVTYGALISAYEKAGDPAGARAVFDAMEAKGLAPNVVTCNALISAYEKAGDPAGARAVFDAMAPKGLVPNVVTYSALISAYEKAGDPAGARAAFDAMEAKGLAPDVVTHSALISAYEKAGDPVGARAAFDEMARKGLAPDVVTYSALISAYEKAGDPAGARAVFDAMETKGLAPNVVTYNALISAYEKAGDPAGGRAAFDEMATKGLAPDVVTYNALISAYIAAGEEGKALALLDEAVGQQVLAASLGYDKKRNELDLHERAVFTAPKEKATGVSADLARLIFRRLLGRGLINRRTSFIVGSHGDDQVRAAIRQCMVDQGWTPRHPADRHGRPNVGCWVTDDPALAGAFGGKGRPFSDLCRSQRS